MPRIAATSDLHGFLPVIDRADLLVIAGDLLPYYDHSISYQIEWLNNQFKNWLVRVPVADVVITPGDHDLIFQQFPHLVPKLPWTVLIDEQVELAGVKIYGVPWQKPFATGWVYNLGEPELGAKYDAIPLDTDVILSHGPCYGFGDYVPRDEHVGSRDFLAAIARIKPSLAVYGHIHEGRGSWQLHRTRVANVTHVNEQYSPVYHPMYFDI